jgi:RNA polymerase sigma-70 factor (sigma-E family)
VEEPAGFGEFVAARRAVLFRAAVLLTGDVHLAEDVLQATFMRVWLRWRSVSAMENPDAYVQRVLVSVFLSWRRRKSWHETPSIAIPDVVRESQAAEIDSHIDLMTAIRRLPPRQRTVIALRYLLDASEAETATAMGCSIGTVKRQAHRAIGNLRVELERHQLRGSTVGEES